MAWLGIDIGGANIKAATTQGKALSIPFPLWRDPEHLLEQLNKIVTHDDWAGLPLAVTMTGELADCFRTKAEGVRFIVNAVEQAAAPSQIGYYTTHSLFVDADQARRDYMSVAAANWHGLAGFAARFLNQLSISDRALLLDIGSSTTDVIPIRDGVPAPGGLTDTERLVTSELVYAGVVRTPLCTMIQQAEYRGQHCGVAREFFASMLDVYLMLDLTEESNRNSQTADGRPANKPCAIDRLARMICADNEIFDQRDAVILSQQAREAQVKLIGQSVLAVAEQMPFPRQVVISGQGEFLAREIAERFLPDAEIISLGTRIGQQLSQVAPAYAIAVLAAENVNA